MNRSRLSLPSILRPRQTIRRHLESLLSKTTLSQGEIAQLTSKCAARRFSAGQVIIREGIRGDFWAVVTRGRVAITSASGGGHLRFGATPGAELTLERGATFGESMLLEGRPSRHTVQALTSAEIYVLRRADLLALARQRRPAPAAGPVAVQLWPIVAALVAVVVVAALGGYLGARLVFGGAAAKMPVLSQGSDAIRIISPSSGQVLQRSSPIAVQAVLDDANLERAELLVDGVPSGPRPRPQPVTTPWVAEWVHTDVREGSHTLVLRAFTADGLTSTSAPVMVTVVPEGKLVFASDREGYHAVYDMPTDGLVMTRLTGGQGDARQPALNGDGALAFVMQTDDGRSLVRVLAAGSDQATDVAEGRDPAWSPDGSRLAYAASLGGVSQVFTTAVAGGSPHQVTAEPIYAGQPAWSPDGSRLAYVAERDGNLDIWVIALDGAEPVRLTSHPGMDWAPAWSPDGSRLAFVSNRMGTHQVYIIQEGGSEVQALTSLAQGAESPAWSPDGHWLCFVAYTGDGAGVSAREIYLMREDGLEVARLTHDAFDDSRPSWIQPLPRQ